MNAWGFDIAFIGAGDVQWKRAQKIVAELASKDGRVGEKAGAYWTFDYGTTELDREDARADVKRMLSDIDLASNAMLDVRDAA